MRNLKKLIVAFIFSGLMALLAAPVAHGESSGSSKPLSVCTDDNQKPKTGGDVDVLLLMDNSRSLNSKKDPKSSTDPTGKRFIAVGDLLESLGSLTDGTESQGLSINFGMISFGSSARKEIDFKELTSGNAEEIAKEVEDTLPALEQVTNYVKALELAIEMLNGRPEANCKFLVWFTDGQFESREIGKDDDDRNAKISKQADDLKEEVCKPDGLAERFHRARINTFVIVLKPTKTDRRLDASYGAMQAITGAFGASQVPKDVAAGKQPDLCGDIASRDHIGDILVAEDASSIARKIPNIGNRIDGWQPVGVCPISSDSADMPEMPAARYLSGISFTAYEKGTQLASLESSSIIDKGGRKRGFGEYLVKKMASSEFEQKFTFNDVAIENLEQGWTFSIDAGEVGWCVQILPQKFEVKFTKDPSSPVAEVKPGGILTSNDLTSITYRSDDIESKTLTRSEAQSEEGKVTGLLDIDPTKNLFTEPISVEVQQLTVPSLSCSEVVFVAAGEDMPKNRKKIEDCIIDTSMTNLSSVEVQVVQGASLADSACSAKLGIVETGPTEVWTDELKTTSSLVHPKGSQKRIHIVLSFEGRKAECKSLQPQSDSNLELKYGSDKTQVIPINIDVRLDKKVIWWLRALIALAILLLVALLNLWLLRIMAGKSSRMSRSGVDAYEVPITLRKNNAGRVEAVLRDGSSPMSHRFDLEMKIPIHVETNGLAASLNKGSFSKLKVIVPPLHRPFAEPSLTLASLGSVSYSGPVIYWESVNGGRGLSPMARSGVILHSPEKSGETVNVVATFLLPSSGLDRQIFVREVLASRIVSTLQTTLLDSRWFGSGGESQGRPNVSPPRESRSPGESRPSVGQSAVPPDGSGRPPQPPPPPRPPSRP